MATLVLGAVGTALGRPIGGALGSLIGQAVDQQLLGGGPKRGPRLGDLAIQTSAYGTMIPRIYGALRVAGSVVWATDLVETEQAVSGGKGGSDMLRYNYTASFAVALSSRPAGGIGRIWADGKLLRGAAGDLKVPGALRLLGGGEAQAADPLIASIEGIMAPGFRGLAVAVFENLALAEYGNRIPMLTFELLGDAGAVTVGAILRDASAGVIASDNAVTLGGYSAHGGDRAAAVAPLIEFARVRLRDDGGILADGGAVTVMPSASEHGCSADGKAARTERVREPLGSVPGALALGFYDPARDYQAGLARTGEAGAVRPVELPAAVGADQARGLADAALARTWGERERVTFRLAPEFLGLQAGDVVRAEGNDWRVIGVDVAGMAVAAECVRSLEAAPAGLLPTDGGRVAAVIDAAAGPTTLVLLDLRDGGDAGLTLAAASAASAWRPVAVSVAANGVSQSAVVVGRAALIGRVEGVLGDGPDALFDDRSMIVVKLVASDGWLTSADNDALAMGANLAAVGDELVQYGRVEPLGSGRFRLTHLLRGRRGSEWAIGGHGAGEMFVPLDPSWLTRIALASEIVGAEVAVQAHGLADGASVAVRRIAGGEGLRPLSPCRVTIANEGSDLRCAWVRRGRGGWSDGGDVPMGAASERYRVRIAGPAASGEWVVAEPSLLLTAAMRAGLGSGVATLSVAQVGDQASSREVRVSITL